jgi:ABC-type Mn2+/Zn2+ transport system ATPase subunit
MIRRGVTEGVLLEIEGLTVLRGTQEVLANFNLNVSSGECIVLSGPNGCGKSTLIEAAAGLLPIKSGSISIQRPFGLTLQDDGVHGDELVHERLGLASAVAGASSDSSSILEKRWNIEHRSADRIAHLATGMRRRISVIQGLLPAYAGNSPQLCLLDEPSVGLDTASVTLLIEDIKALQEQGHAFVIASHDQRFEDCATRRIEIGEQEYNRTKQISTDLPEIKSVVPTLPFASWVNSLHFRTMTPLVTLAMPILAIALILSAIEGSHNQANMLHGIVLSSASFLSAMTTPPVLRYFRENRTGDWWRAQGGGFDVAPLAAIIITLGPFIISRIEPTEIPLEHLLCLGLIMYAIYHANQSLHILADRLPRSANQFVTLLTLILVWPFMLSAELAHDWSWTGFALAIGIPLIITVAVPILHPRTGSD